MQIYEKITKYGLFIAKEMSKSLAKALIKKNHYSKTWYHTFGKINYGLYVDNKLLGVASFGSLKVPKSFNKLSEDITKDQILELNRLWIDDCLGKNSESAFIALCLKSIKANYDIKIIQSFADGRLGCGTIYKASNFKYYGYHETEFFEDTKTGKVYHEQIFHNSTRPLVITNNLLMINGQFKKFSTKTYRYIYLLDKKCKIRLRELPYPIYEKGLTEIDWKQDTAKNLHYIENAIKYMFYKLGKSYFEVEYNNRKYYYSKLTYEAGIKLVDHIKKIDNSLQTLF